MTRLDPRYSIDPLERYLQTKTQLISDELGTHLSVRDMANYANVGERKWQRWRSAGLTWWAADEVATHLGLHPCQLWPSWESDVAAAIEKHSDNLWKRRHERGREDDE